MASLQHHDACRTSILDTDFKLSRFKLMPRRSSDLEGPLTCPILIFCFSKPRVSGYFPRDNHVAMLGV